MRKRIPTDAVICAARHFKAAHDSACNETIVDFGEICVGCSEWRKCKGYWMKTAAPIFDAAKMQIEIIRNCHPRRSMDDVGKFNTKGRSK